MDALERGRACYERREWRAALEALSQADSETPLAGADLDRLIWSAGLAGDDDAFIAGLERQYRAFAAADEHARAARAAFWIGMRLSLIGEMGRARGWLSRAQRSVERVGAESAESGYLLLPVVFRHLATGDDAAAEAAATEAAGVGERCGDADLVALARNLQARAVVRQGRVEPGLGLLDEVMLALTDGEVSPLVSGLVFCTVIATCQQAFALDRAREWTEALSTWCEEQPEPVTFTGACMVHRAEVMQIGGAWPDASEEAKRVCERTDADTDVLASAWYQKGELHRLRGEWSEAEVAYRAASDNGREPQPGLALLRLAQGQASAAASSIRRVLDTTQAPWQRARFLPAWVDIALAVADAEAAAAACDELEAFSSSVGTKVVEAMAAQARGAVDLASGNARAATEPLRRAFEIWQRLGAPYNAARARVLLGRAYLALGDVDGAKLEKHAARQLFEQLDATPDIAALESDDSSDSQKRSSTTHNLSKRELEVLLLVASGKTNKAIASELHVSERTVDRHVSNIFTKIDVSSRAAATAFAYENKLL